MRDLPPLEHRLRFLGALSAWGLMLSASPGVVFTEGSALLAALGVGLWAAVEARPCAGAVWKGLAAHALGALPGAAGLMLWIRFVYLPPLAYIGLGMAIYSAVGGLCLRRILRALPAAAAPLAVAVAWTGMEALRSLVPMPFGLGWLRVGFCAHGWSWLAGSARVWEVSGLTFVLAALGGLAASAWYDRRVLARPLALLTGLGPLALGALFAGATAPPEAAAGPRVLLIQPGFPQDRKQWSDPEENFMALLGQTSDALAAGRAAGLPAPDLVCWGESMLYVPLFTEEVRGLALEQGPGLGAGAMPLRSELERFEAIERAWVRGRLLASLPEGTSFLAGAEVFVAADGVIRRMNGAVIYDAEGRRSEPAGKRFLVPGAETMYGLERIEAVAGFIRRVSGYVPDFVGADETSVLPMRTPAGDDLAVATSVCFDNAHMATFLDPLRGGAGVDFHVVLSNEAWYEDSFEVDQMVAFTRIAALASGRAVVRATNSGISLVMDADGRELGRIVEGGRDRMVRGSLSLEIPVPVLDGGGAPPAVALAPWLQALWIGLAALLMAAGTRQR